MQYLVKYKLFFHTFNKEIEDTIKVDNGLSYFNGERNCSIYNEADAVDYVKATHKLGEIEKLFKVPQEIYDSVIKLDSKDPQRLKKGVEVAVKLKEAKKKMHDFYLSLKNKGKDTKEVKKLEAKIDEYLTEVYNEACGVNFT